MSYNDDVRAALDPRGFNIDSLRRVACLSFEAIDDGHAAHPVVPFVIAMVCTKVASDLRGDTGLAMTGDGLRSIDRPADCTPLCFGLQW